MEFIVFLVCLGIVGAAGWKVYQWLKPPITLPGQEQPHQVRIQPEPEQEPLLRLPLQEPAKLSSQASAPVPPPVVVPVVQPVVQKQVPEKPVEVLVQGGSSIDLNKLEQENARVFFIVIRGLLDRFVHHQKRISRSHLVPSVFTQSEWDYLIGQKSGMKSPGLLRRLEIIEEKADTTNGSITFKVKSGTQIMSMIVQWYLGAYPQSDSLIKELYPADWNGVRNREGTLLDHLNNGTHASVLSDPMASTPESKNQPEEDEDSDPEDEEEPEE